MSDLTFIEQHSGKSSAVKHKSRLNTVKKLTHLYFHDKFIQNIGNLSICENLQVLYLHENEIKVIQNLDPLQNLKLLYLQKNKIKKIEGLDKLPQLKKLYLGCNEISVLEGLENLQNLEELHMEKQRLAKGENLCIDPRSVIKLANTLQILNISHNNLTSIFDLQALKKLKILNASSNNITNVLETAKTISEWYYLTEVNFIGNPMTKQHRYKDSIIANTFRLGILDEKEINDTTRSFIKRFEYEKSMFKASSSTTIVVPKDLPGKIAPTIEKGISKAIDKTIKNSLTTTLNEEVGNYLPWQALKPSFSDTGKTVPALFIRHKQVQKKKPGTSKRVHFSMFPQM